MATHGHHRGRHSHHQDPEPGAHEHGHSHAEEDMLGVEEAYERIMAAFSRLDPVEVPLLESLGQVLASDVYSPLDLPPLTNSAMDGYAVRGEDIQGAGADSPRTLKVIGLVAAGSVSDDTVQPGTSIRIMTGAPIPDGADTVVPFEETDEVQRRESGAPLDQVNILSGLPRGANVRPAGEDVRSGEHVLTAGTVIRPSEIGVMASLGLGMAKVARRPVVSVLATGDELVSTGMPLERGKIFDSNSFSVAASVVASGGIPRVLGIARDNLDDLHRKLSEAEGSDLIITSAGVSKGDYDIVKDVLTQRGEMNFWSVRMRPAKPLAFGHINFENAAPDHRAGRGAADRIRPQQEGRGPVPLMGLPGNPVSAMVAFEMFARPAIAIMLGKQPLPRPSVEGVLTAPIYNTDGRRVYARVEVTRKNDAYYANPTGPQGSNILTSMSRANGLAICPEDLPSKAQAKR